MHLFSTWGLNFLFSNEKNTFIYSVHAFLLLVYCQSLIFQFFFFVFVLISGYSTTFTAHFQFETKKQQRERHLSLSFKSPSNQRSSLNHVIPSKYLFVTNVYMKRTLAGRTATRKTRHGAPFFAICVNSVNVHSPGNVCMYAKFFPPAPRIFIQQYFSLYAACSRSTKHARPSFVQCVFPRVHVCVKCATFF